MLLEVLQILLLVVLLLLIQALFLLIFFLLFLHFQSIILVSTLSSVLNNITAYWFIEYCEANCILLVVLIELHFLLIFDKLLSSSRTCKVQSIQYELSQCPVLLQICIWTLKLNIIATAILGRFPSNHLSFSGDGHLPQLS